MSRPFKATVEAESVSRCVLSSDGDMLALFDYRTLLKFVSFGFTDSAVSRT